MEMKCSRTADKTVKVMKTKRETDGLAANPEGLAEDVTNVATEKNSVMENSAISAWLSTWQFLGVVEVKDVCVDLEDPNLRLTGGIL